MSNVVLSGQSFFNKVVQATGDIDNAFEMMLANNMTQLTDRIPNGSVLKVSTVTNKAVVAFLQDLEPATYPNKIKDKVKFLDYLLPGEFPYIF